MGESSAIEWTDATVNFWWGCTKVGPGCDHCYAESFDKRVGGAHWGQGVPRRKIKSAVATIHRLDNDYAWWAADASIAGLHPNIRRRVFIQSMSDLFDNEVPVEWFAEAWGKIKVCDRIDIQIVTKRISMVEKRLSAIGEGAWPSHAGLMITVVNQAEADRDIPRLLALKAMLRIPWVGLSIEPLLGPVYVRQWLGRYPIHMVPGGNEGNPSDGWIEYADGIDWVIVGGESGHHARPMHPDWARSLRDQCQAAGVPFLFKQWGEWADLHDHEGRRNWMLMYADGTLDVPDDRWPDEEAGEIAVVKVGRGRAGRLLDGVEWNQFPGAA